MLYMANNNSDKAVERLQSALHRDPTKRDQFVKKMFNQHSSWIPLSVPFYPILMRDM